MLNPCDHIYSNRINLLSSDIIKVSINAKSLFVWFTVIGDIIFMQTLVIV